ncbi:MAG: NAD(P)-dependent alcohol dehydrogenase [Acidimicrobiales bacterium]|nr:NAD(P)-dependent alcohol dehydrogenase [Acidimicrobiales bacterium]
MRAIVYRQYGTPDVLHLEEVETPTVGDDEVLVRVEAASVNSWDWDLLRGTPFLARLPALTKPSHPVLGSDVAGRVEVVGRNVIRLRPGDEVFGDLSGCGFGAFAEYARAAPDALAPMPAGLSFQQAAAAPQAGLLALAGLRFRGSVRPGDRVLVNGAGGGVGTIAVQIAKSLGAEVTGVDVAAKLDVVRSVGADHAIDYQREDFTRAGVRYDRIVDVAAHRSPLDYRRALSPTGVYAGIGGSPARVLEAASLGLWLRVTERRRMGLVLYAKPTLPDLMDLRQLLEDGTVVPVIDRTFPLAETADALRCFGAGRFAGKIVIDCT